jgi:hypothetical protein
MAVQGLPVIQWLLGASVPVLTFTIRLHSHLKTSNLSSTVLSPTESFCYSLNQVPSHLPPAPANMNDVEARLFAKIRESALSHAEVERNLPLIKADTKCDLAVSGEEKVLDDTDNKVEKARSSAPWSTDNTMGRKALLHRASHTKPCVKSMKPKIAEDELEHKILIPRTIDFDKYKDQWNAAKSDLKKGNKKIQGLCKICAALDKLHRTYLDDIPIFLDDAKFLAQLKTGKRWMSSHEALETEKGKTQLIYSRKFRNVEDLGMKGIDQIFRQYRNLFKVDLQYRKKALIRSNEEREKNHQTIKSLAQDLESVEQSRHETISQLESNRSRSRYTRPGRKTGVVGRKRLNRKFMISTPN